LGAFVRWQDIGARVERLVSAKCLPNGYPLVRSRLPTNGMIDLCVGRRWQQVKFVRIDGSRMSGNQKVVYLDNGKEKSVSYDWFGVAPAGHFTEWTGPRPEKLAGAELLDRFELAQRGHVIHKQSVVEEDWPYLTFEATSYHPDAHLVEREDMWSGLYTA